MRGAQAAVSGTSAGFFVHESLGPVVRDPVPMVRLGQGQPFQLVPTDRPHFVAVPQDRVREVIAALYAQRRIIVRWYDLARGQHTIVVEVGDFGAAYDYAVSACNWPRLAVQRGAFVPPPPSPRSLSSPGQVETPQGRSGVTLKVSDFPYAWYLRQIVAKINEQWEGRAIEGRQAAVVFEIARDGKLREVRVRETSGDADYDQMAVRTSTRPPPSRSCPRASTSRL